MNWTDEQFNLQNEIASYKSPTAILEVIHKDILPIESTKVSYLQHIDEPHVRIRKAISYPSRPCRLEAEKLNATDYST